MLLTTCETKKKISRKIYLLKITFACSIQMSHKLNLLRSFGRNPLQTVKIQLLSDKKNIEKVYEFGLTVSKWLYFPVHRKNLRFLFTTDIESQSVIH